jgi:hypothetical protein
MNIRFSLQGGDMVTIRKPNKKTVFAMIMVIASTSLFLCSNPTQPDTQIPSKVSPAPNPSPEPNPSPTPSPSPTSIANTFNNYYVDSLLIGKDTTIRSFHEQYFYVSSPTTVRFSIADYRFFNTNYGNLGSFDVGYKRRSPDYDACYNRQCFELYNGIFSTDMWNPIYKEHDTITLSFTKGYFYCCQNFSDGAIDISISFHIIDTIASDIEPNNSFSQATKIAIDQCNKAYLNVQQVLIDSTEMPFFADFQDCYYFESDSGKSYPFSIKGRNYVDPRPSFDILVADHHCVQTDMLTSSSPNDELVIKATSSRTYLLLSSNLTGVEYSFTVMSGLSKLTR